MAVLLRMRLPERGPVVPVISLRRNPPCKGSAELAAFHPAPEEVDLCPRPGAVTGHGAGLEAGEDGIGVLADVVLRPEVKCEFHRLTITLAKHGLDVDLEAQRLVGVGDHDRSLFGRLRAQRSSAGPMVDPKI